MLQHTPLVMLKHNLRGYVADRKTPWNDGVGQLAIGETYRYDNINDFTCFRTDPTTGSASQNLPGHEAGPGGQSTRHGIDQFFGTWRPSGGRHYG
jgi:hypothetical protein